MSSDSRGSILIWAAKNWAYNLSTSAPAGRGASDVDDAALSTNVRYSMNISAVCMKHHNITSYWHMACDPSQDSLQLLGGPSPGCSRRTWRSDYRFHLGSLTTITTCLGRPKVTSEGAESLQTLMVWSLPPAADADELSLIPSQNNLLLLSANLVCVCRSSQHWQ